MSPLWYQQVPISKCWRVPQYGSVSRLALLQRLHPSFEVSYNENPIVSTRYREKCENRRNWNLPRIASLVGRSNLRRAWRSCRSCWAPFWQDWARRDPVWHRSLSAALAPSVSSSLWSPHSQLLSEKRSILGLGLLYIYLFMYVFIYLSEAVSSRYLTAWKCGFESKDSTRVSLWQISTAVSSALIFPCQLSFH